MHVGYGPLQRQAAAALALLAGMGAGGWWSGWVEERVDEEGWAEVTCPSPKKYVPIVEEER